MALIKRESNPLGSLAPLQMDQMGVEPMSEAPSPVLLQA